MNLSTTQLWNVRAAARWQARRVITYSGRYVSLLRPESETIFLTDIARALSQLCRFGGHSPRFYSVAEHSVLAYWMAINEGENEETQAAVLLHDAAEAYIGDVVRPLKDMLPELRVIEERMNDAIGERFGIDFNRHHDTIKTYDNLLLKSEKRSLWPNDREEWDGIFNAGNVLETKLQFWTPKTAEETFLFAVKQLIDEDLWNEEATEIRGASRRGSIAKQTHGVGSDRDSQDPRREPESQIR